MVAEIPQHNPNPFHGSNYTITCTVHIIKGMNLPTFIQWYHSNGSLLKNGHRIIFASAKPQTTNSGTTRVVSLTFAPVLSEDGGEYSCRAQVFVPWMTEQPRVHSSSVDVVVTSMSVNCIVTQLVSFLDPPLSCAPSEGESA